MKSIACRKFFLSALEAWCTLFLSELSIESFFELSLMLCCLKLSYLYIIFSVNRWIGWVYHSLSYAWYTIFIYIWSLDLQFQSIGSWLRQFFHLSSFYWSDLIRLINNLLVAWSPTISASCSLSPATSTIRNLSSSTSTTTSTIRDLSLATLALWNLSSSTLDAKLASRHLSLAMSIS